MRMNDSVTQKLIENEWGCQWIGPEQDPRNGPVTYCGCKVIPGKAYCREHYEKMYVQGSALRKGRSASGVVKKQQWAGNLEELMWEVYEELVAEGEIEA